MDFDNVNPTVNSSKTHQGNYPHPKCDPTKTIVHTTPAAHKPTIGPDPSVVYRGGRAYRPLVPLPKQPPQSPYPKKRPSSSKKPQKGLTPPAATQPENTTCPFVSQPNINPSNHRPNAPLPSRASRYPQHPQVRSVCSPPARITSPYDFALHTATRTNH